MLPVLLKKDISHKAGSFLHLKYKYKYILLNKSISLLIVLLNWIIKFIHQQEEPVFF